MSESNEPPDWGELYRLYRDALLSALGRRGIPVSERLDLVHKAFITLIKRQARGDLIQPKFPRVLYWGCRSEAGNYRRTAERHAAPTTPIEYEEYEKPGAASSHQALVDLTRLETVMLTWTARERAVFHHCFVLGESAAVVAAELNISTQRVRSICCELRARCRSEFDETP